MKTFALLATVATLWAILASADSTRSIPALHMAWKNYASAWVRARRNQILILRNKTLIFFLQFRHRLLVAGIQIRHLLRSRLFEVRICLNKARILCLKHIHLSINETNLRPNFILCRAAIHHPIKVFNVFMDCWHNRASFLGASDTSKQAENQGKSGQKIVAKPVDKALR